MQLSVVYCSEVECNVVVIVVVVAVAVVVVVLCSVA